MGVEPNLVICQKRVADLTNLALDRFVARARRAAGLKGIVNVLVTSSAQMKSLNRRFRGKDKPTDVLSFPADPEAEKQFAGEIAISAELATKNARDLGHSPADEVKILVLHGVLHLRGYDHECDNGQMARREKQLRAKLHLPQGLIERTDSRRDSRPRLSSGAKPSHIAASKGQNRRVSNESTMESVSASATGGRPRRNRPQ
jgi:probable rRNA maturation factor